MVLFLFLNPLECVLGYRTLFSTLLREFPSVQSFPFYLKSDRTLKHLPTLDSGCTFAIRQVLNIPRCVMRLDEGAESGLRSWMQCS